MSASQNKKKTLSLGLALIPVISMLLLLIIGYGIMGLRIEPLLLCSAAVAAGIAWWQGYCWEDIINSVVDKLAKAMPVIMILICVGGLIGTWMFSGTIPYMVYWGLKLISPEYILIAAFFLTSVVFSMMGTILLVFCAFSFAGALTLTGALTIIINRLLTIIHSVGQLIAATIGTTILVTGATSDGKLALLVPAELFKDAYRRMGLDTKNLSRTIEDAGTVIEPLLPWTSAGVYMATTLGVSTLDLLPWAIQCYAAIFFALIYGFSGIGIARTASASEKSPQSSVTE
ncbi:Na+/H+ antiporter NhaC family protein [Salmonella enterica subsp. enterica serovar Kiambu]